MASRFFERKCFTTTSDCLLEFMKEQKDDSSLIFNMEAGLLAKGASCIIQI